MNLKTPICLEITELVIQEKMCYGNPTVKGGIKASSDFKDDAWWLWRQFKYGTIYLVIMMKICKAQPLLELNTSKECFETKVTLK